MANTGRDVGDAASAITDNATWPYYAAKSFLLANQLGDWRRSIVRLRASTETDPGHVVSQGRRRGLSLIEVLVVVGIVAVLVAVTVPAVQWSRERSRAAVCQDNLRQIGIGLLNHHTQFGHLPKDGGNGFGYGALLLPQLDQSGLFDRLKPLASPLTGAVDARARGGDVVLPVFLCPTHEGAPQIEPNTLGRMAYRASAEIFSRKTQLPHIVDGLGSTVAIGETAGDQAWILPGVGTGGAPPNGSGDFGSCHRDVTHFLFCDGSVRGIGDAVDPATFQALFTTSARDVPGDF